jgi:hypothetical protein
MHLLCNPWILWEEMEMPSKVNLIPPQDLQKGPAATPGMRNIPFDIVYVHCLLKADS